MNTNKPIDWSRIPFTASWEARVFGPYVGIVRMTTNGLLIGAVLVFAVTFIAGNTARHCLADRIACEAIAGVKP